MAMLPGRRDQCGDAADQLQRREDNLGAPIQTRFGQVIDQPLRVEFLSGCSTLERGHSARPTG